MTKTLLTIAILASTSLGFAQSIDGKYKISTLSCQSGATVNPNDAMMAKLALLDLNGGKFVITIDVSTFLPGCMITATGKYVLAGDQLTITNESSSATTQCGSGPMTPDTEPVTSKVIFNADGFVMDTLNKKNTTCPIGDHEIDVYTKVK